MCILIFVTPRSMLAVSVELYNNVSDEVELLNSISIGVGEGGCFPSPSSQKGLIQITEKCLRENAQSS